MHLYTDMLAHAHTHSHTQQHDYINHKLFLIQMSSIWKYEQIGLVVCVSYFYSGLFAPWEAYMPSTTLHQHTRLQVFCCRNDHFTTFLLLCPCAVWIIPSASFPHILCHSLLGDSLQTSWRWLIHPQFLLMICETTSSWFSLLQIYAGYFFWLFKTEDSAQKAVDKSLEPMVSVSLDVLVLLKTVLSLV